MNNKVLVAMSGGVDSSVAALLLREQGFACTGAMMKLYDNGDTGEAPEKGCCSLRDAQDAREVAWSLDMPFHVFNFQDRFRREVMDRFVETYRRGATPNPCIDCNRYLKFEKFLLRARELEIDRIATGHYARIEPAAGGGRFLLRKGLDPDKDQSYVLYTMTQDQLSRTLLPLGGLTKAEVRGLAEQHGFVNAAKRESQDICFVPDGDYAGFIERHTGQAAAPGPFVDGDGQILGRHRGLIRYTIGQRKGLGIAAPEPLYVCAKRTADNAVVLGPAESLFTDRLVAGDLNLIAVERLDAPMRLKAKIRYRQEEQWATAVQTGEDRLELRFEQPQRAIAAGQAVVLYDGDIVVGGGVIR